MCDRVVELTAGVSVVPSPQFTDSAVPLVAVMPVMLTDVPVVPLVGSVAASVGWATALITIVPFFSAGVPVPLSTMSMV